MKKKPLIALAATIGTLATVAVPAATAASSPSFTTIDENHAITAGAPLNPYNANSNMHIGYDQMQLAWFTNSPTNLDEFIPGLAKSWQVSKDGTTVTVELQPGAKWSDGTPVTAQDLITSAAIDFTMGSAQSIHLGSVKALSNTKVQYTQVQGSHYFLFLHFLLQHTIVPNSEYGPLLPKNIWTIIKQSQYTGTDPALQKKATAAQNELTTLGKKIAAYAPPKDLSAGPFYEKNLNPGEEYMVKNPYFYAADKVKVDSVTFRNYTGNQQIWNYLIAGQLDQAPFTAMPTNILNQILKTSGNTKIVTPSWVGAALAFNQSIYPYNLLAVRQALAHVIDRKAVQTVAEPVSGTASEYNTGMVDAAAKQWLTKSQLSQLDPYKHDTALAAKELESVGFKKENGQWIMPNGKPWTATIYTVNGFSDWIEAAKVMSSEMTSFGIPTQPSIVPSYSQYLQELAAGKYAIGFWINAIGPSMTSTFGRTYGSNDGYSVNGGKLVYTPPTVKNSGNWLGAPQRVRLPDGQIVNPGVLTYKLSLIPPAKQGRYVWLLAQAVNSSVPMITLWNYINVQFVNTTRFTNFPLNNVGELNQTPGVWMATGYVQPKH
ncbi:MAG: hypothetical protein K6T83_08480 [Alicyclobacillus sp.]|nr:hypothetical protein [Alicyclobacillus sp.]